MKDNDIELIISDKAIENIIKEGFDETYGARPMKRHIQREIESKLARFIIENPNIKRIIVDYDLNQYLIKEK